MNKETARDYLPLVQALAEGKVIQYQYLHGKWGDVLDLYEHNPASDYRIKPEPKEIWVNHYGSPFTLDQVCFSKGEADLRAHQGLIFWTNRYREVIE